MKEEKKGPVSKKQVGRFQVSIWKRRKVVPARDDCGAEREVEIIRACVQYSTYSYSTRSYQRQHIWCNPEELRNLAEALDELGQDEGGESNE